MSTWPSNNKTPILLNENTPLHDISAEYDNLTAFISRRYGVPVDATDLLLSLKDFVSKYRLPPAPVVLMEIQLDKHEIKVQEISPAEAVKRKRAKPEMKILDAREDWERKLALLPQSELLTATLLDDILNSWRKDTPILVYCHHGIRSKDAAVFLADRGFEDVAVLKGGIDAWSTEVDPSIPRYDGQYC